jgi:hypothetical protein
LKTRIVSSVALAAAIALGATGCSLYAEQGTAYIYAPSDGIDVNAGSVEVRNIMFIVAEEPTVVNTVFTAVNPTEEPQKLTLTVVTGDDSQAIVDLVVMPGTTVYGNPKGDIGLALLQDSGARAGGLAQVYFQSGDSGEVMREVPVLDGTLQEYQDYVLSNKQLKTIMLGAETALN